MWRGQPYRVLNEMNSKISFDCSAEEASAPILKELEALVAKGHRSSVSAIEKQLHQLSLEGLAIRLLLERLAASKLPLKLASAQSFIVHQSESYTLRLNVWLPEPTKLTSVAMPVYDKYFSIGICHNHNFDFFTVNVLGPGYDTELKTTHDPIENFGVGDVISFVSKETVTLTLGETLFVEADTLFHTQFAPPSVSITVNLIPNTPAESITNQFILDEDRMTIKSIIGGS